MKRLLIVFSVMLAFLSMTFMVPFTTVARASDVSFSISSVTHGHHHKRMHHRRHRRIIHRNYGQHSH